MALYDYAVSAQARGSRVENAISRSPPATSRTPTQRDLAFGTQRFIPKAQAKQDGSVAASPSWFHDDHHDHTSIASTVTHPPTPEPPIQGAGLMGDRNGLFTRLRSSNRSSGESLMPSTRELRLPEVKRERSKKRFFDAIRSFGSRRNTTESLPRFTYEAASPSWAADQLPVDSHLPAPAPNFGDVPGVGYERAAPHVDLSSGAAARAAAAAQKLLTNNMRRLDINSDRVIIRDSESGVGIASAENEPSLSAQGPRKGTLLHSIFLMIEADLYQIL